MNKSPVKKIIILMVSDPWEFGTQNGCGPFEMQVTQTSERALLLRFVNPLEYQGVLWELLVAVPRHAEDKFSIVDSGEKIICNFIRTDEEQVQSDSETFGWRGYRGKYSMLIGTLSVQVSSGRKP